MESKTFAIYMDCRRFEINNNKETRKAMKVLHRNIKSICSNKESNTIILDDLNMYYKSSSLEKINGVVIYNGINYLKNFPNLSCIVVGNADNLQKEFFHLIYSYYNFGLTKTIAFCLTNTDTIYSENAIYQCVVCTKDKLMVCSGLNFGFDILRTLFGLKIVVDKKLNDAEAEDLLNLMQEEYNIPCKF